jgi:acetaldehyde dehydrogenase (acetylating)
VTSARASFAGENLVIVSWSGNHELGFREAVIGPFNERCSTKVETVGGQDRMASQIVAAPANNPPLDLTIADECTTAVRSKLGGPRCAREAGGRVYDPGVRR